jgi:hypothetical protein
MSDSLYGQLAEFSDEHALLAAARQARQAGFRRVEAYAPYAIGGLPETVGVHGRRMSVAALVGAVIGGVGVYILQSYATLIDYPINMGGRPMHSWPSFVPATFEIIIPAAALAAVFGMLLMNGWSTLRLPLFDLTQLDLAARDRFFLCVTVDGVTLDHEKCLAFLYQLDPPPLMVCEVPL